MGADAKTVLNFCRDDTEALSLVSEELTGKPGDNQYTEVHNNVINPSVKQGNGATYALRRLKKQRPDLYRRVIDNELS